MTRRKNRHLVAIALVFVGLLVDLLFVRSKFGEWGLLPSSFPARLNYHGRTYNRGVEATPAPGDPDVLNAGPGHLFLDAFSTADGSLAPTVIYLERGGRTVDYGLSGGP